MTEPIGTLIKNRLIERKIVFKRFGEYMGMSERSLQYFFKRDDISLKQVLRASEYLNEDLTQYYVSSKWKHGDYYTTKSGLDDYKILIEIAAAPHNLNKLQDLLIRLREVAKEHGFDIG